MAGRKIDRRGLFTQLFKVAAEPAAPAPSVLETHEESTPMVARLQPAACLAYRGTICTVCVERCPVSGAITIAHGRPRIVQDTCTGCGDCVARCPAPVNALSLLERN